MKYMKMLGLLAVAAAALMAFVGTASATITSPAGTKVSEIVASSSNTSLDGSVKVSCTSSSVTAKAAVAGETKGTVSALTFSGCGTDTVSVINKGTLSVTSAGAVSSTGAEVTVQLHRTVLGFPVTTHCIYKTNNTSVGTLTEGVSPAVLHIGSSPIPEVATDGACGNDAVWTGSYTVSKPAGAITVD